jgi:GNAT superfamily N-acetyltransferase
VSKAPATLEFLERVLAAPLLRAEYPLVAERSFPGATVELTEDGGVRAACTILEREFVLGERRVRGGLIGSVATDPSWRRRGLATRLLARAEAELAARGCLFALLWADEPSFYLKRGYAPFGEESDTLLVPELAAALPEPSGVRELRPLDVPFLHRLHARHRTRLERSAEEMRALLGVPGMLTLVRERSTQASHPPLPVAYACLGRGRDLPDAIHEWGGEPQDVLALVRAHLERRFPGAETGALFLMAPPDASELRYRLVRAGAVSKAGILGLGKLLDGVRAAELLDEVLERPGTATFADERLLLRGPTAGAELDLEACQALLFGGPGVRGEVGELLTRLGLPRADLPLAPFAFGLDSI